MLIEANRSELPAITAPQPGGGSSMLEPARPVRLLGGGRVDPAPGVAVANVPPHPSAALGRVLSVACRLAPHADVNLVILGETGVGKEWLARLVHEQSGRPGAFVPVNVNAIPAELFEGELMGTARGAFTGAVDRPGAVARAAQGTLFLDEIGDLDAALQVKLLRFVEERRVTPLGGREQPTDVRIIAATNRKLADMVAGGGFRRDLLHRFAAPLVVPPLRERREEIIPLATRWLGCKAEQRGMRVPRLDARARRLLESHHWPGNVRQLQMVLSQAMLLGESDLLDAEILESLLDEGGAARAEEPAELERASTWASFRAEQAERQERWLERLLLRHDGNVEAAARASGCPASTLRSILKRRPGRSSR